MADERKPCCQDPANLSAPIRDPEGPGLEIRVCRVCACRHYELTLEPGVIGLRGSQAG
jgi:hypothetical protein